MVDLLLVKLSKAAECHACRGSLVILSQSQSPKSTREGHCFQIDLDLTPRWKSQALDGMVEFESDVTFM